MPEAEEWRQIIFDESVERLEEMARKAVTVHNRTTRDAIVIAIHVDDPIWRPLVDALMPDTEETWAQLRREGKWPIARGIVASSLMDALVEDCPDLAFLPPLTEGSMRAVILAGGGASVYEIPLLEPILPN